MAATDTTTVPLPALGEGHAEILRQVSRFAEARHYPHGQRMDDEAWWPTEVFPDLGGAGYLGVQVHSGAGCIWETETIRPSRAGKLTQIGAGTTEMRRIIVARELLGV